MGVAAGLSLREFWRLTPYGLQIVLAGYNQRLRHQYEIGAFVSANIMNIWTKRRIRPDQLLRSKRTFVNAAHFKNSGELEAYLARKREAVD